MLVKSYTNKAGVRSNGVFTADGVKLFGTSGVGSKRRCYDFIARQGR
jgi:hypothetical protein